MLKHLVQRASAARGAATKSFNRILISSSICTPSRSLSAVIDERRLISKTVSRVTLTHLFKRNYADEKKVLTQKVPPMGDSIVDGTIQKLHKAVGDPVKVDEVVASIETDKVVVEIRAQENGIIKEINVEEGANVAVGADVFKVEVGAAPAPAAAPAAEPAKKAEAPAAAAAAAAPPPPPPKAASPPPPSPAPKAAPSPAPAGASSASTGARTERRERMPKIRVRIANRLKDAQNTYAMLTTFQEVDMSTLMELRGQFKDEFEKANGVKLGFMSTFVKAAATALQEQPIVNAVIDNERDEIVYRDYIDISVAVAGPTGLVVPVLRDVDKKSFADVEKNIAEFGKKARSGTLSIDEMSGGTFTISNGGVYGSLFGTPIINPPQSAILGMHAINQRPVVVDGQIVIRPMMYLALTYDHRIIDGKEAVTFLKRIKEIVEQPVRLLLS